MASSTVDILATETAFISIFNEDTNYHNTSPITMYGINYGNSKTTDVSFLKFLIPENQKKKKLSDIQLFVYTTTKTGDPDIIILYYTSRDNAYYLDDPETPLDFATITHRYFQDIGSSAFPGTMRIQVSQNNWCSSGNFSDFQPMDLFYKYDGEIRVAIGIYAEYKGLQEAEYESVTINGISGETTPYIKVFLDDPTAEINVSSATSGFLDRKKENTVFFDTTCDALGGIQAFDFISSSLEWKIKDQDSSSFIYGGSSNQITIPKDTLPSADIQFRIISNYSDLGLVESPWYTITTSDSIPDTSIVYPKNQYINGNEETVFSWDRNIATGTPQSKFEIEVSTNDGVSWTSFLSDYTSETSVTVDPNTLPSGSVLWRVRTANQDEVFGPWSEYAIIVVRGSPQPPIIESIGNEPMPTIRWQSDSQAAVEIKIDNLNESFFYGYSKTYTLTRFLKDGEHTVSIRVQNRFGLWSEWSTSSFQTENLSSDTVELSAQPVENGVGLLWTGPSATYWIERDGEKIAEVNGGDFVDYTAIGEHSYRVRAVLDGGYYALSNEVSAVSSVQYAVISRVDPIAFIALEKRRNAFPTHTETIESLSTFNHYSGRSLPVAEISLHKTIRHQFDFTFKVPKESYVLDALLGETVLYKDCNGACFVGVLSAIDRTTDRASDITLTIMETGG